MKLPRPLERLGLRLSARAARTRDSGRSVPDAAPGEFGSKRSALTEGGPDPARLASLGADCPEDEERPWAARKMPGRAEGLAFSRVSLTMAALRRLLRDGTFRGSVGSDGKEESPSMRECSWLPADGPVEVSVGNDGRVSLERLVRAELASADGADGDCDADVTAELDGVLLSGVPSAPLLNILSNDILPLTRCPTTDWSASEPADLGRELVPERLDGLLLR